MNPKQEATGGEFHDGDAAPALPKFMSGIMLK